jgi:hypothetical protein
LSQNEGEPKKLAAAVPFVSPASDHSAVAARKPAINMMKPTATQTISMGIKDIAAHGNENQAESAC